MHLPPHPFVLWQLLYISSTLVLEHMTPVLTRVCVMSVHFGISHHNGSKGTSSAPTRARGMACAVLQSMCQSTNLLQNRDTVQTIVIPLGRILLTLVTFPTVGLCD